MASHSITSISIYIWISLRALTILFRIKENKDNLYKYKDRDCSNNNDFKK